MNISDYLLDPGGQDWVALLSDWSDALPPAFTVWLVNRFGDVFAVFEDDSVHMLDVGACTMQRIADSRDHFAEQIDVGDNADDWLMIPLVDSCVAAGLILREDQCYGYKVPPILEGEYEIESIEPTNIAAHYSLLADLYNQTKDLPDGTRVRIVVRKRPEN